MSGLLFKPLSSDLYSIPKGHVLFQPLGSDAMELLGDTDAVEVDIAVEETERYTNESGVRILAKTIITQVDATLTMTLVQLSDRNRALSLLGDVAYAEQAANLTAVVLIEDVDHKDKLYSLNALNVSSVVVTDGTGDVTYVANVDYRLDAKAGLIQFINKPALADDDVEINFSKPAIVVGDGFTKIGIANRTENRGKLMIRGTNEVGPQILLVLHDVQLRPTGGRSYISETELDTIEIEGRVFRDENQVSGLELGYEQLIPQ